MWKEPKSKALVLQRAVARAKALRQNPLRQCSKCRQFIPLLDKHGRKNFYRHPLASDGFRPSCKDCDYKVEKPRRLKAMIAKSKRIKDAIRRRKAKPNMLAKRWLSEEDICFHFKVGKKTFSWWRRGGYLMFPDIRFPKPKVAKPRPLWPRSTVIWWEDLLIRRKAELQDRIKRLRETPLAFAREARAAMKAARAKFTEVWKQRKPNRQPPPLPSSTSPRPA